MPTKRSMFPFAALGALPVLAAAALTGCAQHQRFGNDPPIQYPTNHAVNPPTLIGGFGGTYSGAFLSDPKTFNLWVADDADSGGIVGVLYDTLEARDSFTLKFIPRLAYLPKVSADGLTYTYTLRPGLRWSDGQPITADDVIFTLDVIFDPKVDCPGREGMLIDVPQKDGTTKREPFKYEKVDERTVRFILPTRWAPAEEVFSINVAPKHVLEPIYKAGKFNSAWGIDTPPSQLVASGPYVISSYTPSERIVFKRNPYFWRDDAGQRKLPYLDQFQYAIVPDLNGMVLDFRGGYVESVTIPASQYPSFARYSRRDNYTVVSRGPDWGFSYLGFNLAANSKMSETPKLLKLFNDKRFRQACSYAIDRDTICNDVFLGLAHPLYSPETPADVRFYDPNVKQYPFNPAKARQMLLDMGCTPGPNGMLQYEGEPIRFNIVTNSENNIRKSMETIIAENLRKVGLDVIYTSLAFNDLIRRLHVKPYDWQACVMGFTGGPEPNDGSTIWRSSGDYHPWWPNEPKPEADWEKRIDDDFAKGAQTIDPEQRKKYYNDWQEIIGEQQPLIFLCYQDDYSAVRNHYANLKPSASYGLGGDVYWNMEEMFDTHVAGLTR